MAKYIKGMRLSSGSPPRATYDHSEEAGLFDTSVDRMLPPLLVTLTQLGATSMLPMRRRQIDGWRRDAELQTAPPRRCGFSATQRGNFYARELKASTAATALVQFQIAVKGFGLQTLDLARLCHACTLPRWRRVRRRHARRRLRGAGRGSSLRPADSRPLVLRRFVRSIDRARGGELSQHSEAGHDRGQHGAAPALPRARQRPGAELCHRSRQGGLRLERRHPGHRQARVAGLDAPDQMLRRRPDLPHHMAGGPDNPMGARGIYLGASLYRIHGSNEPDTIGQAVSSGCIRLTNEDVIDLYNRVRIGATVIVQ